MVAISFNGNIIKLLNYQFETRPDNMRMNCPRSFTRLYLTECFMSTSGRILIFSKKNKSKYLIFLNKSMYKINPSRIDFYVGTDVFLMTLFPSLIL